MSCLNSSIIEVVADAIANVNLVGGSISNVNTLAGKTTELGLLGTSSNVTNMGSLTGSGVISNLATVAGSVSNVSTVGGAISNVNNVGGSIAAVWLRAGAKIIGVDISDILLNKIKSGNSHKKEPLLSETFTDALKKGTFTLSSNGVYASKKSSIKIIAVPVGLKNKKVDLQAVIQVTKDISKGLKKGDTVILSPSLPPGTTENIVLPILEKGSKLKGEKDFYLIYNPERIFEGRAVQDIEKNYLE